MTTPHSGEHDPEDLDFRWAEEGDEEITPEARELLESITRSVRGRSDRRVKSRQIAENVREDAESDVAEMAQRLLDLQVRGVRAIDGNNLLTVRHIERFPDLGQIPYLLEDVHYEVYRRRKEKSPSPYVSIGLDEILSELGMIRDTRVDTINLQRAQLAEAVQFFQKMSIEEDSLYEAMATPEGRSAVKSLHRLFRERPMGRFINNYKKIMKRHMDERPYIQFNHIAIRALKWFDIQYSENQALGTTVVVEDGGQWRSEFPVENETGSGEAKSVKFPEEQPRQLNEDDPDESRWYELRMREMDRAKAFTDPVVAFLAQAETLPPAN